MGSAETEGGYLLPPAKFAQPPRKLKACKMFLNFLLSLPVIKPLPINATSSGTKQCVYTKIDLKLQSLQTVVNVS